MKPDAVLINRPSIDFNTFLGLSSQALGLSVRTHSRFQRPRSVGRRTLPELPIGDARLQGTRESGAKPAHACQLQRLRGGCRARHAGYSPVCCGYALCHQRYDLAGIQVAVITGTLAQWRDAVKSGRAARVEVPVRQCFNKIHFLFESAGLKVWSDCRERPAPDQTFYLEDKRNR